MPGTQVMIRLQFSGAMNVHHNEEKSEKTGFTITAPSLPSQEPGSGLPAFFFIFYLAQASKNQVFEALLISRRHGRRVTFCLI
jgi:hypothetical protein